MRQIALYQFDEALVQLTAAEFNYSVQSPVCVLGQALTLNVIASLHARQQVC